MSQTAFFVCCECHFVDPWRMKPYNRCDMWQHKWEAKFQVFLKFSLQLLKSDFSYCPNFSTMRLAEYWQILFIGIGHISIRTSQSYKSIVELDIMCDNLMKLIQWCCMHFRFSFPRWLQAICSEVPCPEATIYCRPREKSPGTAGELATTNYFGLSSNICCRIWEIFIYAVGRDRSVFWNGVSYSTKYYAGPWK